MAARPRPVNEEDRARRIAARDRGEAAIANSIQRHRATMHRYLDLGLAQKAVDEYERVRRAKVQLYEWRRLTARWGDA